MAILIKGMEMPKTCEDCNLESLCSLWIEARRLCGFEDHNESTIRHPDCPLIEVPDGHKRLIDADALAFAVMDCQNTDQALAAIDDAPTIIPAFETDIDVGQKEVDDGDSD